MRFAPRLVHHPLLRLLTAAFLLAAPADAAFLFPWIDIQKTGEAYQITVGELPLHYFHIQHSTDLRQFSTIGAGLGEPAPTFGYVPGVGETRGFFRAQAISSFSPSDLDNDGIDDLWELLNGLDPLNPADAGLPSAAIPGMTHLEAYRFTFGLTRVTEFYSVETSVFNSTFAISAETSVYNFPVFTGPSLEAISAEVSLFNTPPDSGPIGEALSSEVSVFNSFVATPALQAVSLEVSVLKSLP
ncbi:MAG: hypothetical protein R3F13_11815 [Prosthecobacter sp.]